MHNPGTDHSHFPNYHGSITSGNSDYSVQSSTENSGKLKVEDALKYIDRIKGRFNEENYKKFLVVMKDFKAQKIKTETVIQNVLTLFHGHQDLIEGFNTFLPPGYQMSAYQNLSISNYSENIHRTSFPLNNTPTVANSQSYAIYPNSVVKPSIEVSINSNLSYENINIVETDRIKITQVPSIQSDSSIIDLKSIYPGIPQSQTTSEFSHAVEYVNKIKNRFQKQPNVYKRFLEILHWYQKEQSPDLVKRKQTETEVSQEVAKLFDSEQDLLQEFITFLPDLSDNDLCPDRRPFFGYKSIPDSTQNYISSMKSCIIPINDQTKIQNLNVPKIDNVDDTNDKNIPDNYRPAFIIPSNIISVPKSVKRNLVQNLNNDRRMSVSYHPPSKRLRTNNFIISSRDSIKINLLNNHELSKLRHFEVINAMCQELLELPSETAYYSFINTIDLFNKRIMNPDQLKSAFKPFFSKRSEIWQRFINLLNKLNDHEKVYSADSNRESNYVYEAGVVNSPVAITNLEDCDSESFATNSQNSNINLLSKSNPIISKNLFWRKNIELNKLEICGSHYRILPEEYTEVRSLAQSKSKICKQVLNYNFICHRSLSIEDTLFVFSKKTVFEESIFQIEDERYEIDMVMEMNKAAIIRLAHMQIRLKEMTPEQISDFNFEENLCRSSSILFYKAIQRIYGDKAVDIINGLKNHPVVVAPIILERLKEKDIEWKEKIKQFQRYWRNQDLFLFKSLDYQAINFRAKDSRMTRPKALLCQLDAIVKVKPLHINNFQEIGSVTSLIESLLSTTRTWKLEKPDKWGMHAYGSGGFIEYNEKLSPSPDYHMLLLFPCDSQYAKSILDYPFQQKMYLFDKLDWYDLLSDAASLIIHHLKRQSNFSKNDKTNMKILIRVTMQDIFIDERFNISDEEADSINCYNCQLEHTASHIKGNTDKESHYKLFLGSRQWYVFIRLYHLLINRLASLKIKTEQLVSKYKEEKKQGTKEFADLLLYKKSNQLNPEDYYQEAINLVKDLPDNFEDTANFEDKMREMFGIHGYIWFSMDKLITTLVKQLQIISCTDNYSRKLSALFRHCGKYFCGQDYHENKLKINITGTGTHINARNEEIIKDEFAYIQAASRLSMDYNKPLILILFHRNPPTKCSGHMCVTLLDVSPGNSSRSESQKVTKVKDEPTSSTPGLQFISKTVISENNSHPVMNWRQYIDRYVNGSKKYGVSDRLHNIRLNKEILAPLFLLRSLRKSLNIISNMGIYSDQSAEKDRPGFSVKNCIIPTDWHSSIVQLTCYIFDGANEDSIHKFLKNTIMMGHMCPVAKEGDNLLVQYETTKLTWSVGSCGIFFRVHKPSYGKKSKSDYIAKIRRIRFLNFQNLWLSQRC